MTRVLLFSLGFGAYSFAALVIMQHYAEAQKLSKSLLLFVLLMALNFVVRAWMYFEWLAPLHGLALGVLGILISLLPIALHHYLNSLCKKQASYHVTYGLFVVSVLTALPIISISNFGMNPQDTLPWSYSKWFWVNASNFAHVVIFLLNSAYVLNLVWRLFKQEYQGRAIPWLGPLRQTTYRNLRLMSYILAGVSLNAFLLTCHCFSIGPPSIVSLVISFLFVALSLGLLAGMLDVKGVSGKPVGDAHYAKSGLQAHDLKRITQKLDEAMERQCLYKDISLSLELLASKINEKPAHISQCLTQCHGVRFFEFISRYRIELAKSLLADRPDMNILEVSEASGFSSKSSFYAAFKRQVGTTPKAYQYSFQTT